MLNLKIEIPDNFLQEEVREGYVVSVQMKEVWAVLLDLLQEFRRVCEENNIRWFADAGTILGAVRHGGMIPWDDDIDVMMLRADYDRFCSIAPKAFNHPYFFQIEQTDPGCLRGHAQLRNSETTAILECEREKKLHFNQGVFLDIFPIENMPVNMNGDEFDKWTQEIHEKKCRAIEYRDLGNCKLRLCKNPIRLCKRVAKYIEGKHHYSCYQSVFCESEQLMTRYKGSKSDYVSKLCLPPFKERRLWKREWFNDVKMLKFEFYEIPVPIGYIDLLNKFYGNWHEFVIGTSTHGGVFFDVHKPYTSYIQ